MKTRIVLIAGLFLFVGTSALRAQATQQECTIKYNLFKGDYQSKKYDDAYPNLIYLLDNCPTLSINIYKFGDKLAKAQMKAGKSGSAELVKRIYEGRIKNYPKVSPAKAHSDYVTFLMKNKLASESEVLPILEKAYKLDPTQMGVKNIYRYFQGVTDLNKDSNPQLVFDTYDDVIESVGKKVEDYKKKLGALADKEAKGGELDKRETRNKRAYTINLNALGQIEGGLDKIIIDLSTCERLIPLYTRDFDNNKSDAKWLKRAVSRMYNKECTDDPLFEKIATAYAEADPSADAYYFVARVKEKNGDKSGAEQMMAKAYELETDPVKKANFKLKFAQNASKKGQKAKARQYAREALQLNPNLGKAYLFIANLYAKSLNSCGKNEFEKRMTFVAAHKMARRAASVDPSVKVTAGKFLRNYKANFPSKKVIFTEGRKVGESFTVKCWINETVKVTSSGK